MPPSDPADAAEERLSRHRPASALYEFATFRDKASPLAGEWKVTARYELHNGGPAIRCIRAWAGASLFGGGVFSAVRADSPAGDAYARLDKQVTLTILVV